jgi:hypothetical protein
MVAVRGTPDRAGEGAAAAADSSSATTKAARAVMGLFSALCSSWHKFSFDSEFANKQRAAGPGLREHDACLAEVCEDAASVDGDGSVRAAAVKPHRRQRASRAK